MPILLVMYEILVRLKLRKKGIFLYLKRKFWMFLFYWINSLYIWIWF